MNKKFMKNNFLILLLIFFCVYSVNSYCMAASSSNSTQYTIYTFETGIQLFIASNSNKSELLIHWHNYLKKINGFSNEDFLQAARHTSNEFTKIFRQIEICNDKLYSEKRKNSHEWLKNVETKFGKNFIQNHFISIQNILIQIHKKHNETYCSNFTKELLYKELAYRKIREFYFNCFIEFVDSLNLDTQKKFADKRSQAEEFLAYITEKKSPLQIMINYSIFYTYMYSSSYSNQSNTELKNMMIQHPGLNKPFNLEKVLTDLENYLKLN